MHRRIATIAKSAAVRQMGEVWYRPEWLVMAGVVLHVLVRIVANQWYTDAGDDG